MTPVIVREVRSLRPRAPLSSATGEMRALFQALRQRLCARQLYFMQLLMNLPWWPAKRHRYLARSLEKSSCCQVRGLGNIPLSDYCNCTSRMRSQINSYDPELRFF